VLPRRQERRLPQARQIRPDYAGSFHCIGSACEETCCKGWNVPIDRATYEKYQNLPASPLRTLIDSSLQVNDQSADGAPPASFANIRLIGADQCPILSEDGLCRIQSTYGEEFLSQTCTRYPRMVYSIGGIEEKCLTLSCPEAARLVLLDPDLLRAHAPSAHKLDPAPEISAPVDAAVQNYESLRAHYWPIRASVLALIRNRAYPLWQRLFLLGIFCRRLDSIAKGELQRPVDSFLRDFEATLTAGSLRLAMETLPIDRTAQLDVVLRLAGLLLHRSNVGPRFADCIKAFTTGIGNGPNATLESLAAHYVVAHDNYFAPFIERHPQILENYLINTVIRCQFPFGREGTVPGSTPSLAREYALLTAQFALMKGLLIGVAGYHRESFSTAHVVHTIQSASKHFEHTPEFLNLTHALLLESQMDTARGLAILLRNSETPPFRSPSVEIQISEPQEELRAY
jgi:lysine-N-methylase